jgi:hypothetical protein
MSNEAYPIAVLEFRQVIAILAAAKEIQLLKVWARAEDLVPPRPDPELRALAMEMEAFAELSKLWDVPFMRVHVDPAPLVEAARKFCEENLQFLDELEERLGKVGK